MNYAEMTDFEINCEVLALMEPDVAHMQLSADQESFYHCGYDGNGFYETTIPDYCNSWADAGPIILANKITISAPMEYDQPADWLAYPASDSDICVSHPNPLRAAMTAFLVMQEAANE